MSLVEQLKELAELHSAGSLTDEQFENAKNTLLGKTEAALQPTDPPAEESHALKAGAPATKFTATLRGQQIHFMSHETSESELELDEEGVLWWGLLEPAEQEKCVFHGICPSCEEMQDFVYDEAIFGQLFVGAAKFFLNPFGHLKNTLTAGRAVGIKCPCGARIVGCLECFTLNHKKGEWDQICNQCRKRIL